MKLPKVRVLRDNLRKSGWHMTAFSYDYNHHSYIVLFEDAKELGCRHKFTIAYITFLDRADINRILEVEANTCGFDNVSPSEIMNYFYISDKPSRIGFFDSFGARFNASMPEQFAPPADRQMKIVEVTRLGERNHDPDPSAVYCYDIRRNPRVNGVQYYRTLYNSN